MTTRDIFIGQARKTLVDMWHGRWKIDPDYIARLIGEGKPIEELQRAIDPEPSWDRVAAALEELPIHTENVARKRRFLYFVLGGNEWWPAEGYVNEAYVAGPTLLYNIRYADGSVETGVALPGRWAHCTMDDTPSIPFMFGVEKS